MTRETKIGMVVAVSFLCLVGVVVATKCLRNNDGVNEVAQNNAPKGPAKPSEPKEGNPAQPGLRINAQHVIGDNSPINSPTSNGNANSPLPVAVPMSDPSIPALPMVPALPTVNGPEAPLPTEQQRKDLLKEINQQNNQPLPPAPMPLPSVFNKPNEPPMNATVNGTENKNVFGPANNQPLAPVKSNDTFNKANEDIFNKLPTVADVTAKTNEGADKTVQGASDKFDALLNKANDASNKGLDNLNKGLDNANKNLSPPLPAPVSPVLPVAPMTNTTNSNDPLAKAEVPPLPAPPAPMNPNFPPPGNNNNNPLPSNNPFSNNNNPLPNNNNPLPNNPFPKVDEPRPVIPAPTNQNLPAITNSNNANNSGFTIPAPGKASDVKVTNYDAESFVARPGDSFASLSKAKYGSDAYGNALLAFNRDYNREYNPNAVTLQGQKVMFPSRQFLEDRYLSAAAGNRSGVINSGGISLNPPVPAIPKSNLPAPPTSDVTKSYRVPAAGQPIYQLAIETLGDGGRWTEIYRLNPNIDPLQPIPGGSVVRLPANARVP